MRYAATLYATAALCFGTGTNALEIPAFSIKANAAEIISSGECGYGMSYELTSDGVLTFSGTGSIYDFKQSEDSYNYTDRSVAPWHKYSYMITSIEFPMYSGIYKIPEYAFMDCYNLISIELPENVTTIGVGAFAGCSSLTSVTFPDKIENIGEGWCETDDYGAFQNCTSLKNVTIPDKLTEISPATFRGCTSFTEIYIPDTITEIGIDAFDGCTNLTKLRLPDGLENLEGAFGFCKSLKSVVIPESVTSLSDFDLCDNLESVYLPDGLESLGGFMYCENLKSIDIPENVTRVSGFSNCDSLTSVKIPDGVTYRTC